MKARNSKTEWLSGPPAAVIERTRSGLSADWLGRMSAHLGMPRTQLYEAVGLSRSTMENRIRLKQPLSAAEGDRLVRIARALQRAEDVLGSEAAAIQWLRRAIRSVGGVAPITLLDTEAGYELVLDTLGRIEQGIAA